MNRTHLNSSKCITKPSNSRYSRLKKNISDLPIEILCLIFKLVSNSTVYYDIPLKTLTGHSMLLRCATVSKLWCPFALKTLHHSFYRNSVIFRAKLLPTLTSYEKEWSIVCFLALACLNSTQWGIGPLRLFFVEPHVDLQEMMELYPDPKHAIWNSLLSCSCDVQQMFFELAAEKEAAEKIVEKEQDYQEENEDEKPGPVDVNHLFMPPHGCGQLLPGQKHIPMMLRYSDKMDLGAYLLLVRLRRGAILLRMKPIGIQNQSRAETGDGLVVIWDAVVYGSCSFCKASLVKMQVCGNWYFLKYFFIFK